LCARIPGAAIRRNRYSRICTRRLTERLKIFNCIPAPIEQVWLSQQDWRLRAPSDE
jgi:transposase